ncbi:MAG: Hsp20/alpha crystallin family protein [Candidatus Limnocylindrales bacterium]
MTLMLRDPFDDTVPLRQAMERLFDEGAARPTRHWLPVDVYETAEALVIKAALPGFTPDEVDIAIDGDILTIIGASTTTEEQSGTQYHRRELHFGTFERTLRLPERFQAEQTAAVFEHGILTLTIPKAAQALVKHIKVQPGMVEAVAGAIKR